MSVNKNIIDSLTELVDLIKIEQNHISDQKKISTNDFRIRAINYLISIVKKHKQEINNADDIKNYPRIGKGSLEKVTEILETGTLQEIKDLKKKYKKYKKMEAVINELTEVVGIGNARAIELIEKHGVKSLKDLKNKFKKGEIELNEKIQLGLKYVGKFKGEIPRKEVDDIAHLIETSIQDPDLTVTFCGSYRRGSPFPNDIDVLLCHLNNITMDDVKQSDTLKDTIEQLKAVGLLVDDIAGENSTTKYMGFCKYKNNPVRRIDIRVMPVESYYTAILYFTGSYELNKVMRQKAKNMGLKLNEYGLFSDDGQMDVSGEEDVFRLLNMDYLPPEER
jgi:DNA polymerase/3'-5' exonuclease PolX